MDLARLEQRVNGNSILERQVSLASNEAIANVLKNPCLNPSPDSAGDVVDGRLNSGLEIPILINLLGAEHLERRRAVAVPFGPTRVHEWHSTFLDVAERHIAHLNEVSPGDGSSVELGESFARPFAGEIVGRFLGLNADRRSAVLAIAPTTMDPRLSKARRSLGALRLFRHIGYALDELDHCDDSCPMPVMSRLVKMGVSRSDVIGITMTMLVAGIPLTSRSILAMLVHSKATAGLSRENVDVSLSAAGIVPWVHRIAARETTVGEERLRPGERIQLDLRATSSADSSVPYPFGFGAHYCLGSAFVREALLCAIQPIRNATHVHNESVETTDAEPIGGPAKLYADLK